MPSFPIRPTFPIDVRSPSGAVKVGRQGASVTLDLDQSKLLSTLPVSPSQFFAALEAAIPGATATVQAAVPSDPTDPANRAFRLTNFVTPGCALAALAATALGLTTLQINDLLAQAAFQPK